MTIDAHEAEAVAATAAADLDEAALDEAIAAACRGSGNPASLAWLAEGLGITATSRVVDLGSGLGGPAAWISRHYHPAFVVALEPAYGSSLASGRRFAEPVVQASADAAPLRTGSFDVALLLGVLSVVDDASRVVAEAARLGARIGALEYCSTTGEPRRLGGSCFPTTDGLTRWLTTGGLALEQLVPQPIPPPDTWRWAEAVHDTTSVYPETARSEREVVEAIERGELLAHLAIATRTVRD